MGVHQRNVYSTVVPRGVCQRNPASLATIPNAELPCSYRQCSHPHVQRVSGSHRKSWGVSNFSSTIFPQLNPIEVGFSMTKRFIEKNANLVFGNAPELLPDLAFKHCTATRSIAVNLLSHCGYEKHGLTEEGFGE